MTDAIVTPRLRGERLDEAHLPFLIRMNADPVTMSPIGGVRSEADTREYLRRNLEHWREHGFGIWIVTHDGRPVGRAGFRRSRHLDRDEVELAYAFVADAWGQGFATEFCEHALRHAPEPRIVAITRPGNAASRRVMEKLGFRFESTFDHHGKPTVLYALTGT